MYIVIAYSVYLAIALSVTVWVAHTLHRNGRAFLADAFHRNTDLADSVNHLLVVGFYLINVGFVAQALRTTVTPKDPREVIELVSDKIGIVLLVLGVMHFLNLAIFNQLRRRHERPLPPGLQGSWAARNEPLGKVLD